MSSGDEQREGAPANGGEQRRHARSVVARESDRRRSDCLVGRGSHDITGSYMISFTLAAFALLGAAIVSVVMAKRRYSIRYITATPAVG
jgi:hypothetical protein